MIQALPLTEEGRRPLGPSGRRPPAITSFRFLTFEVTRGGYSLSLNWVRDVMICTRRDVIPPPACIFSTSDEPTMNVPARMTESHDDHRYFYSFLALEDSSISPLLVPRPWVHPARSSSTGDGVGEFICWRVVISFGGKGARKGCKPSAGRMQAIIGMAR